MVWFPSVEPAYSGKKNITDINVSFLFPSAVKARLILNKGSSLPTGAWRSSVHTTAFIQNHSLMANIQYSNWCLAPTGSSTVQHLLITEACSSSWWTAKCDAVSLMFKTWYSVQVLTHSRSWTRHSWQLIQVDASTLWSHGGTAATLQLSTSLSSLGFHPINVVV